MIKSQYVEKYPWRFVVILTSIFALIGILLALFIFDEMPAKYRLLIPISVIWMVIVHCSWFIPRTKITITQQEIIISNEAIKWESIYAIVSGDMYNKKSTDIILIIANQIRWRTQKTLDIRHVDISAIDDANELKCIILKRAYRAVLAIDKIYMDRTDYWGISPTDIEKYIDKNKIYSIKYQIRSMIVLVLFVITLIALYFW